MCFCGPYAFQRGGLPGNLQEGADLSAGGNGEYSGCVRDRERIRAEDSGDLFYISNEGVSLLENAGHLGLPIPQKMKDVLEQLHDRGEGSDGE